MIEDRTRKCCKTCELGEIFAKVRPSNVHVKELLNGNFEWNVIVDCRKADVCKIYEENKE